MQGTYADGSWGREKVRKQGLEPPSLVHDNFTRKSVDPESGIMCVIPNKFMSQTLLHFSTFHQTYAQEIPFPQYASCPLAPPTYPTYLKGSPTGLIQRMMWRLLRTLSIRKANRLSRASGTPAFLAASARAVRTYIKYEFLNLQSLNHVYVQCFQLRE